MRPLKPKTPKQVRKGYFKLLRISYKAKELGLDPEKLKINFNKSEGYHIVGSTDNEKTKELETFANSI